MKNFDCEKIAKKITITVAFEFSIYYITGAFCLKVICIMKLKNSFIE